ncbi:unnamed protein product [Amoebophrya sp. A25]|nr:unnamed protein product [Amoebophrya sp. A25]|eukprot:GSA25T00009151001.1
MAMWHRQAVLRLSRHATAGKARAKGLLAESASAWRLHTPTRRGKANSWAAFAHACRGTGGELSALDCAAVSIEDDRRKTQSRSAQEGVVFVHQLFEKVNDKYEIFVLPRCSRGSFLIRLRTSERDNAHTALSDGWQAIQVKNARKRHAKAGNKYIFCGSGSGPRADVGLALVCAAEKKIEFVHEGAVSVQYAGGPQYWICRDELGSPATCFGSDTVVEGLEKVLHMVPKRSVADWLFRLALRKQDRVHQSLMQQFALQAEQRLGKSLQYLAARTDPSNAIVAGKRSLLRSCEIVPQHGKALLPLERHRFARGQLFGLPFDAIEDNVDLYIIMLFKRTSDKLEGAFIFPKTFLAEEGILSISRTGGQGSMVLYPPGSRAISPEKEDFARRQRLYYVSFDAENDEVEDSSPDVREKHITAKFRALLKCKVTF